MGLWAILTKPIGENPHAIRWREPTFWSTRLRRGQIACMVMLASAALSFAGLGVLAIPHDNWQESQIIAALGALCGLAVAMCVLIPHDDSPGKVAMGDEEIRRDRYYANILPGHCFEWQVWPYGAIRQAILVPRELLGLRFSMLVLFCGNKKYYLAIPARVDLHRVANHLTVREVPVIFGDSMPEAMQKPRLQPLWLGIFAVIGMTLFVFGFASAAKRPVNPVAARPAPQPAGIDWHRLGQRPNLDPALRAKAPRLDMAPPGWDNPGVADMPVGRPAVPASDVPPPPPPPPVVRRPAAPRSVARQPDPPPAAREAAPEAEFRQWTDSSGTFHVEARFVEVSGGKVAIKTRGGKNLAIPLDRLSKADQEYVAQVEFFGDGGDKNNGNQEPPVANSAKDGDTELAGGTEGWTFRHDDHRQLLGIRYQLGGWDDEKTVGVLQPIYDQTPGGPAQGVAIAKEGYAVGGLKVDARRFVNAMQIVFMRRKSNGRLDPSDSYTSEWIGFPTGRPAKTLGGTGATVVGLYGRNGAILNAVGLILAP